MKAWRAFVFLLLLVCSATGLLARPTHSFSSSCHLEGLGSVRYLTDTTGIITDTFTYDAFGILIHRQARTSGGVLGKEGNERDVWTDPGDARFHYRVLHLPG